MMAFLNTRWDLKQIQNIGKTGEIQVNSLINSIVPRLIFLVLVNVLWLHKIQT